MEFKQRISKGFPNLFVQVDEQGEQEADYTGEGQFAAKYGWFTSLYALAGGDVTKFDEVTKTPLLNALMFLEFDKDKTELEIRRNKRLQ